MPRSRRLALYWPRCLRTSSRPFFRRLILALISRLSVSIWVSPGPLVPIPPPRRSRWDHCPASLGSRYSCCASSTCRLPSRLRALTGEDVQYQGGPVDDLDAIESVLQVSLLRGFQLVIADDGVQAARPYKLLELLDLSLAQIRLGRPVDALGHGLHHPRTRAPSQLSQLLQGVPRRPGVLVPLGPDADKADPLCLGSGGEGILGNG